MKMKRILGAFLALAMMIPVVLTGCKSDDSETTDTSSIRQNIVLNMYILTDEKTDLEQAQAVEIALNEILLPDYRTVVKINYIHDDGGDNLEYWNAINEAEDAAVAYQLELEAKREAEKAAKKEKNKAGATTDATAATTDATAEAGALSGEELEAAEEKNESEYDRLAKMIFGYERNKVDENGNPVNDEDGNPIVEKVKPEIVLSDPQIDIFLVNSASKYIELAESGRLTKLDDYLKSEAKLITSNVYPTFITGATSVANGLYGIPVNKAIGEYEYLVFNKELLDKYGVNADDLKTIDALSGYLATIAANEPGVVPLALSDGGVSPQFYEYYQEDGGALGAKYNVYGVFANSPFAENADEVVKTHFAKIREYKLAGYIPDTYVKGTPFAVDVRKGYADSPAKWAEEDGTEYVCQIYKRPVATTENTLDSVFVVSSASRNPARATEIITLFNTNAKLANLLQYGIEEEHYYRVTEDSGEKKINVKSNGGYYMNNDYTGHHYIKDIVVGETDRTEAFKQQNLDSLLSMFYGFDANTLIEEEILLEKANNITKQYYEGLCRGQYDVDTVYATVNAQLAALTVSENEITAWVGDDAVRAERAKGEGYSKQAENAAETAEKAAKEAETAAAEAEKALKSATRAEISKIIAGVVNDGTSAATIAEADATISNSLVVIQAAAAKAEAAAAEAKTAAETAKKVAEDAELFVEESQYADTVAASAATSSKNDADAANKAQVTATKAANDAKRANENVQMIATGKRIVTAAAEASANNAYAALSFGGSTVYATTLPAETPEEEEIVEEDVRADDGEVRTPYDEFVFDFDADLYEYTEANTKLKSLWSLTYRYFNAANGNEEYVDDTEDPLKVIIRDEDEK